VDSSGYSTVIGDRVTVGHSVVLHGCSIGDDALVGIGSIVLNGAEVGAGAMVAPEAWSRRERRSRRDVGAGIAGAGEKAADR